MKGFARPEGKRSRDITKPGTARTRRTELGLVERSDRAGELHSGTAEATLLGSHSRFLV